MADYKIIGSSSGIREDANKVSILLKDAAAISQVPEDCAPGSFASTADYSYMARKGLDGEWHQIGGASNA